ncbi:MAG: glyoxylase I family protein [Flavobacteriales bacterium]|jgi:glyoxylase I family protein
MEQHVAHLGGIFIHSESPKDLADWYTKAFGLTYEYTEEHKTYYISFPYLEVESKKKAYAVWSILNKDYRPTLEFRPFTLNFRIKDLEKLKIHLESLGIEITDIQAHDEGKFAWSNDPEGNYIELWEDTQIA